MSDVTPELEKVARAIMPFTCADDDDLDSQFRACVPEYCQCRKAARAALLSMREPTPAMNRAVLAEHMKGISSFIDEYRAAIDAALGEDKL